MSALAVKLPTGVVTLLLGDIEGSTRLWEANPEAMASAVARYDALVDEYVGKYNGARPEEQGEGDSFLASFEKASDALNCALDLQIAFATETWPAGRELRLRIGVHTGEAMLRDEINYMGPAINRGARLRNTAHGGQTVLSQTTYELVADQLREGVTLKDLGSHRLRDLSRPERVYQIVHPDLPTEFPALVSLSVLSNNLPIQLTSFIGRESEVAELKRLLDESRLVTLTGGGGSGKTRLALETVADLLDEHPDGVWFVDLASLTDEALVPNAALSAMVLDELGMESALDTLKKRIGDKRLMIVLDNCEHVVGGCAQLADTLLRSCPEVRVLATSREPLGVEGETSWHVPSLSLPRRDDLGPEVLTQCEAVRLFEERARKSRPNFKITSENAPAIARICRRLEGIPLAIELAAARTRVLSVEQIEEGLSHGLRLLTGGSRTAQPRQQTLEASIDWSFELLSDAERTFLTKLSVFTGGFTLEAAEEVCSGGEVSRLSVLDLLSGLVERSLVQTEDEAPGRYRLLEPIRQYLIPKLATSRQNAEVRDRHLDFYLSLASPYLEILPLNVPIRQKLGCSVLEWLDGLELENENLRTAMDWGWQAEKKEKVLLMFASLPLFWYGRGHLREGYLWTEKVIPIKDVTPATRAQTLLSAGMLRFWSYDFTSFDELAEEATRIARDIGDTILAAGAQIMLGSARRFSHQGATDQITEGIETARGVGDEYWPAWGIYWLGWFEAVGGDLSRARGHFEEALAIAERTDNSFCVCFTKGMLGFVNLLQGCVPQGKKLSEESLALARQLRNDGMISHELVWIGFADTFLGDYDRAERLVEEGTRIARQSFFPLIEASGTWIHSLLDYARGNLEAAEALAEEVLGLNSYRSGAVSVLANVAMARGDLAKASGYLAGAGRGFALVSSRLSRMLGEIDQAEDLAHGALERFWQIGNVVSVVSALEAMASCAALQSRFEEAARLFGAVEAMREEIGLVRFSVDEKEYSADVALLREGLTAEEFEKAWAEGRALSAEEAVAYASRGRGQRKRPTSGWKSLTPTELKVVKLVAEGLTNPQIGEKLFVSKRTVQSHLSRVFAKVGVSTRAELAAEAVRRRI